MTDLLSAASLLLAIVGVFYGLWYNDISSALATPLPKHVLDKAAPLKQIRTVLFSKAIPLATASCSAALVFLPSTLGIIRESACGYATQGAAFVLTYDALKTSLVLVEVFTLVLAANSLMRSIGIARIVWPKSDSAA